MQKNKEILEERIFSLNPSTKDNIRDSRLYNISFDYSSNRIIIESDYILSWIDNFENSTTKTWQVPAFIIFENVFKFKIDIDWDKDYLDITIDEIYYEESLDNKIVMEIGDFDLGKVVIECQNSPIIHLIGEPVLCQGTQFDKKIRDEIINSNMTFIKSL